MIMDNLNEIEITCLCQNTIQTLYVGFILWNLLNIKINLAFIWKTLLRLKRNIITIIGKYI